MEQSTVVLAGKVQATGRKFDRIATVSRGGLVPARLMADRLGIKEIIVDPAKIPPGVLFVDDIYDSGRTFRKMASRARNPEDLVYATLVARRGKKYPKQLVYARRTRGMEYIVFPWERDEYRRSRKGAKSDPKNN